ncbi:hypothetical protein ACFSC3_03495 [Sphingomonas floccifaciens]|uniref:Uncharacterized protein n=1 Tax=Sphingomonas floccifaciens TaxID=1844115 RepID=A0ABW4N940_9SPHN
MTIMSAMPGITAPPLPGRPRADAATVGTRPLSATRTAHPRDDDDDAPWPYGSPEIDLDEVAEDFALAAAREGPQFTRSRRADGWTPDRQRAFLDYIAQGLTVSDGATLVGLSATSAYAFRQRAAGAAFAVGWQAALLLQRNRLVDELTSRAFRGNTDTVTNHKGETVERHRHDNRLALALLTRLDKIAAAELPDRTDDARAARLAAQDWDRYLDLIGADASPAQAGLFLSLRSTEGESAAIAPIVALARADLYRRTGASHVGEVQVHDLDPARRHAWSADDWARAEAGGLVSLAAPAPTPESAGSSQLPQHSDAESRGVWWSDFHDDWRTAFPPPPGFDGAEEGQYGGAHYQRALSDDELAVVEAWEAREIEAQRVPEETARVRFFAELAGESVDAGSGDGRSTGEREAAVAAASAGVGARAEIGGDVPLPVRAERVEGAESSPHPVRAELVGALPSSSGRKRNAGGGAAPRPRTVRAEPVEARPCSSGRKRDRSEGAEPPPQTVCAEPVEALPCSSGDQGEAGVGANPSSPTVRAELVEAPLFGPRAMGKEERQPFDGVRANGCGAGSDRPTGPDAGVNPASSDGAVAPPAGRAASAGAADATPWPARPTGPAAGVNPASSDGAAAPPAGAGTVVRVRSFATD